MDKIEKGDTNILIDLKKNRIQMVIPDAMMLTSEKKENQLLKNCLEMKNW